jgi:hypothetical protein
MGKQLGLSSALSKPAVELEWWLGWVAPFALLSHVTVLQCLLGRLPDLPKSVSREFSGALAIAARNYLTYRAQRARLEEMRKTVWAREPRAPLAALAGALHRLYDHVTSLSECRGPVDTEESSLVIGDDPPRATALFRERQGYQAQVEIVLSGHE